MEYFTKKVVFLLFITFLSVGNLYSRETETDQIFFPEDWTVTLQSYSPESVPPSGGGTSLSQIIQPLSIDQGLISVWLTGTFTLPDSFSEQQLYFTADQFNGAVEFWIDGESLGWRGSVGKDVLFPKYIHKYITIPPGMIRKGKAQTFSVRLVGDSSITDKIYSPGIFTEEYMPRMELATFTNAHMYVAFSLLALFIALYYLLEFIFNRKKINYLYFFLANTALTFYFFEMGSMLIFINMGWTHALGKAFLSMFFLFLTLFLIKHFNIFNVLGLKIPVILVGGFFFASFFFIEKNYHTIDSILMFSLMPATVELVLLAIITSMAVKRKRPFSRIILIGISIGISFGMYDIILTFAGIQPLFWLQGPGIILFNISLFISHVLTNIATGKQLMISSKLQKQQSEQLENYVSGLQETSGEVADISSTVTNEVNELKGITEHITQGTELLSSVLERQDETVQQSEEIFDKVLEDFNQTSNMLNLQINVFKDATQMIKDLLNNLSEVDHKLQSTVQEANTLETLAQEGNRSIENTRAAMDRIVQLSAKIDDVVEVMSDLAGNTNLLAMNAAIEAAHAGNAGKGFAVVASEIQRLAEASALSSTEVQSEMSKISESISEGLEVNEQLANTMGKVSTAMQSTAGNLREVLSLVDQQQSASREIDSSINTLNNESGELQERVDRQLKDGTMVRDSIRTLVQATQEVSGEVSAIIEDSRKLGRLVQELDSVSGKSSRQVERLRNVLEKNS